MDIVFIGAGRLATNMARALSGKGHRIVAVYSRTLASAQTLSSMVGGMATDNVQSLATVADAFIVAVKDSVLAGLIPQLTKDRVGQAFFHTAGSVPMSVFQGNASRYGVIYPMQTFSKERLVDFSRVPIFIEACDEPTLLLARTLAASLSGYVQQLSDEARRHLHLAAVFACNFANHCYALSAEVLKPYGIPFEVMLPLIEETASKVQTMAPRDAQTGPAIRYDENIINAQIQLLQGQPMAQQVYRLMSQSIHQLAEHDQL